MAVTSGSGWFRIFLTVGLEIPMPVMSEAAVRRKSWSLRSGTFERARRCWATFCGFSIGRSVVGDGKTQGPFTPSRRPQRREGLRDGLDRMAAVEGVDDRIKRDAPSRDAVRPYACSTYSVDIATTLPPTPRPDSGPSPTGTYRTLACSPVPGGPP